MAVTCIEAAAAHQSCHSDEGGIASSRGHDNGYDEIPRASGCHWSNRLVEPLLVENGRHLIEFPGEVVTKISYEQLGELAVFRYDGACRVGIDQDIRQVPER